MKNRYSQNPFQKVQNAALSLLARRRHSREEVRRKLLKRGFEVRIVEKVLSECERLQYIDDDMAADFFTEELIRKGLGLLRIQDAMKNRGFDRALIERTIDTHQLLERESELAAAAAEKKMSSLQREPDPRKRVEKVIRFLRSRGFRPSTISMVLGDIQTPDEG